MFSPQNGRVRPSVAIYLSIYTHNPPHELVQFEFKCDGKCQDLLLLRSNLELTRPRLSKNSYYQAINHCKEISPEWINLIFSVCARFLTPKIVCKLNDMIMIWHSLDVLCWALKCLRLVDGSEQQRDRQAVRKPVLSHDTTPISLES